ncbi:SDR family NAD(P)-dependent oxidoreductase [Leifsonia shinshuensis]|uniref:SDR family NAD(P)-dependent oxidoreductase n=1 Tax=Leifsonia shinshuensis TaxID=150026 RepID=UPI002860313E|nr:SDR family NAD(P)-dependent oxidoreductase [Leifsonia shinshuensis]MDR6970775.1 NAD(P)-dependent dehydrogenase (short-subunit alcohol dehydrogenase family) [Leifsonia shinshuensis]
MDYPAPTRLTSPLLTLPDLAGRRAVVTGGASGLGLVTTRTFALQGADVIIGARDVTKAEAARAHLLAEHDLSAGKITVAELDLIDPDSIERFAGMAAGAPMDLLVLNAGISSVPLRHDRNGIESQFATNHLGHFALAARLLPSLEQGTDPRVVTVSSALYAAAKLDLEDLASSSRYSPGRAYNRSKLANVMFALELGRRLAESGSSVRSFAAHPGMARTPLHTTYPSVATRVMTRIIAGAIGREPGPADVGVLTAALHPDASPELFWGPTGSKTHPDAVGDWFKPVATDLGAAVSLWEVSERLTGTRIAM